MSDFWRFLVSILGVLLKGRSHHVWLLLTHVRDKSVEQLGFLLQRWVRLAVSKRALGEASQRICVHKFLGELPRTDHRFIFEMHESVLVRHGHRVSEANLVHQVAPAPNEHITVLLLQGLQLQARCRLGRLRCVVEGLVEFLLQVLFEFLRVDELTWSKTF